MAETDLPDTESQPQKKKGGGMMPVILAFVIVTLVGGAMPLSDIEAGTQVDIVLGRRLLFTTIVVNITKETSCCLSIITICPTRSLSIYICIFYVR